MNMNRETGPKPANVKYGIVFITDFLYIYNWRINKLLFIYLNEKILIMNQEYNCKKMVQLLLRYCLLVGKNFHSLSTAASSQLNFYRIQDVALSLTVLRVLYFV